MNDTILALKYTVYAIFIWLGISREAFGILLLLMCIDSIVGAIKAVRLGRNFSFKALLWGFSLKLCFLIIPLIVALLGKQLSYDFSMAVNITIIVLSVSEGYSSLGNIYAAKNKVELNEMDIVSLLLKTLRLLIRKNIQKLADKLERSGDCDLK